MEQAQVSNDRNMYPKKLEYFLTRFSYDRSQGAKLRSGNYF